MSMRFVLAVCFSAYRCSGRLENRRGLFHKFISSEGYNHQSASRSHMNFEARSLHVFSSPRLSREKIPPFPLVSTHTLPR